MTRLKPGAGMDLDLDIHIYFNRAENVQQIYRMQIMADLDPDLFTCLMRQRDQGGRNRVRPCGIERALPHLVPHGLAGEGGVKLRDPREGCVPEVGCTARHGRDVLVLR